MVEPPIDLDMGHRWFAVTCNNQGWDLLEQAERSAEEDARMLHLAHAACLHWLHVGQPINHQRALVLLANVHSAVGDGQAALRFAQKCLLISQQITSDLDDFDWAFAYEALGRAHAAAKQLEEAKQWKEKARIAGDEIASPQEKQVFETCFRRRWFGLD